MLSSLKKFGLVEFSLVQIILYSILWLTNEYLASLLTTIMVPLIGSVLVISFIVELIEKSKVPRSYFIFMTIAVIIPIVVAVFFFLVYGGQIDWIEEMQK